MHAPTVLHLEEAHELDAILAFITFGLGFVGLLLIAFDAPRGGLVCGAIGVLTGLWGQLVSRTRSERFFDVVGLVAAAVAFAVGAALGDLHFSG